MHFKRNGVSFHVNDDALMDMVLRNVAEGQSSLPPLPPPLPLIGSEWPGGGGVYAGNMRGRNGTGDYHLIVGPQFDGELQWKAAMDWAAGIQVGLYKDFTLPFRAEQALLSANVPELFGQASYWSCEQNAGLAGYVYTQSFFNGGQASYRDDSLWNAWAVRRIPI